MPGGGGPLGGIPGIGNPGGGIPGGGIPRPIMGGGMPGGIPRPVADTHKVEKQTIHKKRKSWCYILWMNTQVM